MEHFYQNIHGWSRLEDQGVLLEYILKNTNLNETIKIAEIGVFMGRGTALWNVELINKNINYEYYAIDHFLGSEEHEKGVDYYNICKDNLKGIEDRIKIIENDSVAESKNYEDEFFNIVYIDASHDYENVKQDILSWYSKVKNGGFLCGDDYHPGWSGVVSAVDEIFGKSLKILGNSQWLINKS
jgi:hypothetical protein